MSQIINITVDVAMRSVRVVDQKGDGTQDTAKYTVALPNLPLLAEQLVEGITGTKTAGRLDWVDALGTHGFAINGSLGTTLRMVVGWKEWEEKIIHYIPLHNPGAKKAEFKILVPPRLWILSWRGGVLHQSRIFCGEELPQAVVDDTTMIGPYPGGNVYNDGRICWGSTPMPTFSIGAQTMVDHLFFSSIFNGDVCRLDGGLEAYIKAHMDKTTKVAKLPVPEGTTTLMRALGARGDGE